MLKKHSADIICLTWLYCNICYLFFYILCWYYNKYVLKYFLLLKIWLRFLNIEAEIYWFAKVNEVTKLNQSIYSKRQATASDQRWITLPVLTTQSRMPNAQVCFVRKNMKRIPIVIMCLILKCIAMGLWATITSLSVAETRSIWMLKV